MLKITAATAPRNRKSASMESAGAPAWIRPIGSGLVSTRYTMTAERTAMKAVTGQNPGPRFVFGLTTRCAN